MVNKFCCFSLEASAKFFGWLGCISATAFIALDSFFGLFYTREIIQAVTGKDQNVEEQSCKCKRQNLMLPWLIARFVGMMVYVALMLRMEKKYVLSSIPAIAFNAYLWFCMLSLYERIRNEKQRRPIVTVDLII
ncbi:unnamed protein product [Ceratitis capitata]|uniref:(Mediterranean fruit fly) hypothetical protein n=1 Tax=Ceratitis capitata TaxID=7213 RepID=A0A811VDL0_CERCA|nr:unnamed protein product [Ceratitis capitata]